MTKEVAQGGFNTGRLYTSNGQMIYYWAFENGWAYFKDISRMVDGYVKIGSLSPRAIMQAYDNGPERCSPFDFRCEYNPDYSVPNDYDFGEFLKI